MGVITRAIHNIGTAVWWGGTVMGTMAMNPAVEVLDDPEERGKMVDEGWALFQPYAAAGLLMAIITHVKMRRHPPSAPSQAYKATAVIKDLLMATALASSVASMALGEYAVTQDPDIYTPIESATGSLEETPADVELAQQGLTLTSCIQLVAGLGLFVAGAIMDAEREG
ncbi:MAG: hypothetical protein M3347_01565 [Armatimonadota bacterium]|nr:hypothetical protein [Armatimonadota bacterium]